MSTKILSGILIRFTINLFISLGRIAVFIMLSLLINRYYVYLSRSSCFHQHFVMFSKCHIHILLDLYLSFPKLLQMVQFSSVDHVQLCNPMDCSMPGLPVHQPAPGVYSDSCPLSQLCHPTILSSVFPFSFHLQPFSASGSFPTSQFFASDGQSIGVSASVSVLNDEYSGLISFRMDWLDLPAVQGTLKSLLQHHSSKASILWPSAFFRVQLSHPYMTTGKTRLIDYSKSSHHPSAHIVTTFYFSCDEHFKDRFS